MNKNFIILIVVLLALVSIFFLKPGKKSENLIVPSAGQVALRNRVAAQTVAIKNFSFNPRILTVPRGATVIWKNEDSSPHQIKFKEFDSSPLAKGESFSHTFETPGAYAYVCTIFPSMSGTIIVE